MSAGPIEGLHTYIMLRTMYENYYCGRDQTTTEPAAATATVLTAPTTGNPPINATTSTTGKPLTNVPAWSVSVWKAFSSVAGSAAGLDPNFPPLSATVVAPVSRFDQQAQMDSYFNSLLDKKLDGMRQETNRAPELVTAKTDSALESMGNRLSLQERTLAASVLQTRVDPINRS